MWLAVQYNASILELAIRLITPSFSGTDIDHTIFLSSNTLQHHDSYFYNYSFTYVP